MMVSTLLMVLAFFSFPAFACATVSTALPSELQRHAPDILESV
jgi:hypothetical protein